MTWVPTEEIKASDEIGATEHVCKELFKWCYRLSTAIAKHTNDEKTRQARDRSEKPLEQAQKAEKEKRWADISWTLKLEKEVEQAKGKKGKGKGKSGAKNTQHPPRCYTDMTKQEQWWLDRLWSGELHDRYKETTSGPIAAQPYVVGED